MNNYNSEVAEITRDLQKIINDLDTVAKEISTSSTGINSQRCAREISQVADHYRDVKAKLNRIDFTGCPIGGGGGGGGSF